MSASGSSASRKSSCATIRFADCSLTSVPRKTIRSRRSREKMSNERSYRPSDSTTIGINVLLIGCASYTQPNSCTSRRNVMEVEREVVFPAAPDEVWDALTEAEPHEEWF